jgi:ABC-2 type transport system permease protein
VRAFWVLARMRLFDVLRSRGATFVFLGLPLVLLLVLAAVFAEGHPFERKTVAVVRSSNAAPLAARLEAISEVRVELEDREDVALRKLEARATDAVVQWDGAGVPLLVVSDRTQLWGEGLARRIAPNTQLVTRYLSRWGYLHYLFPGLLCSAVMFSGLFGMGYAMARYRQNAFLKKLATTPLARSTFVSSQVFGRSLLVLAQVAVLILAAALFGLRVPVGSLAGAALIALFGLFAFSGLGFLLASVIESDAVVGDVISALGLPLTLFSGVFFPVDALPSALALVAQVLPSTLMIDAARAALLYDASLLSALPQLLGLALWGGALFALSVATFRWHD